MGVAPTSPVDSGADAGPGAGTGVVSFAASSGAGVVTTATVGSGFVSPSGTSYLTVGKPLVGAATCKQTELFPRPSIFPWTKSGAFSAGMALGIGISLEGSLSGTRGSIFLFFLVLHVMDLSM